MMSRLATLFLTASATALLLYRVLLMLGAEHRLIFDVALMTAGAVFALWVLSMLHARAGKAR
jgi:hypothetical protein